MNSDDRQKAQGARLAMARSQAGYKSTRAAAVDNKWPESSVRAHEAGTRTIGLDDAERYARLYRARGAMVTAQDILFPDGRGGVAAPGNSVVRIMGYVGAGAEINPDFEQVPPDGLEEINVFLPLPAEMVGFKVKGDSMLPRYDEDDVIICFQDQKRPIESFFGDEAAVRTEDGRRYLKRIAPGPTKRTVNLESYSAQATMAGVRLAWIGEIWITVRRGQFQRIALSAKAKNRPPR